MRGGPLNAIASECVNPTSTEGQELLKGHFRRLIELWHDWADPVWIADTTGRVLYCNPAAEQSRNGIGRAQATARIAGAIAGSQDGHSDGGRRIEVSSLTDARGRRVGWLAVAVE